MVVVGDEVGCLDELGVVVFVVVDFWFVDVVVVVGFVELLVGEFNCFLFDVVGCFDVLEGDDVVFVEEFF